VASFHELFFVAVLKPMGIENLPVVRTWEADGKPGTPVAGWGSYPTVIEAAKIGRLPANEGVYEGRTLLNRNKIREALERIPRRGIATNLGAAGNHPSRYLHSVWLIDIPLSVGVLTSATMSGHGGNFVVMLPGGNVALRFSDQMVIDGATARNCASDRNGIGPYGVD
jgi:hypothetical protein